MMLIWILRRSNLVVLPSWSSAFPGGMRDLKADNNMPSGLTFPMVALFFLFSQIICTFFVLFRVS